MSSWTTIESDPAIFTELINAMGCTGTQVEELYDLEPANIDRLKPIYGLIFLFKWRSEPDSRPIENDPPANIFFAKQVVNNACATQALLSILLNRSEIDLGSALNEFKSFTADLPPEDKGWAIGSSELIRTAHNSFARPEPFVFEQKEVAGEDDEAFHFITYVPINGKLYELDGLKRGPIVLNPGVTLDNWIDSAREAIQARITRYASKEIRFNLLAVVQNRQDVLQERLTSTVQKKLYIEKKLGITSTDDSASSSAMDTSSSTTTSSSTSTSSSSSVPLPKVTPLTEDIELDSLDQSELQSRLSIFSEEIIDVRRSLEDEVIKQQKWKLENVRRKHNYVPFIFNLLKMLAEKGKLTGLVEQAAKVTATRQAKSQQQRKEKAEKEKAEKAEKAAQAAATAAGTAGGASGGGAPAPK